MAQEQLADYQTRLGQPFLYEAYLAELRELRDQLKDALSTNSPAADEQQRPSVSELADRIKLLQAAHAIEPSPQSSHEKRVTSAEVPVTTRVRRRLQTEVAPTPDADSAQDLRQVSLPPLLPDMSKEATPLEPNDSAALATTPRNVEARHNACQEQQRQLSLF
jgi:hypothetical protein